MTSSTSIDHYFATKLANLQSKAKKNKPVSEALSQEASDIAFTCSTTSSKRHEQKHQQLRPRTTSETDHTSDCGTVTEKKRKKKEQKIDDNCCTNDDRLHSKSLHSNVTSQKKRKQDSNALAKAILQSSDICQNGKTAETSKKNKKRLPRTTVQTQPKQLEHINTPPKKRKKSAHVDCPTT